VDVASELDSWISGIRFPHRLNIARGLGMITAGNHKPGVWKSLRKNIKGLNHELQPLVRSPLAKGKDPMRVASAGEVRIFGPARQNTVRTHMHIVSTIFLVQYPPVARHQDGDGVCQQQHPCREFSCEPVGGGKAHPRVFQIYSVHQVVQRHVGVASTQARKKRSR
jgi:hypothetical protein